jgi:RHS repeat-associated protein
LDAESGLQYNRARYLDSFTGKFISEDPIGFQAGDPNLYRYVANNSLNFTDPLGESASNLLFLDTIISNGGGATIPLGDPGRFSGKAPWQPRDDSYEEKQRLYAINLVKQNSSFICEQAKKYKITPDAIAGAILWEGIENPYRKTDFSFSQSKIPGKIHAFQFPGKYTEMQKVEEEGRVPWDPFGNDYIGGYVYRRPHLEKTENAIIAIAAILDRSASIYERLPLSQPLINGINIRNQAGVLTSLYQGGNPEGRSENFARRVREEASRRLLYKAAGLGNAEGISPFAAYPQIPTITKDKEAMGAWVSFYRNWISREFFSKCKSC